MYSVEPFDLPMQNALHLVLHVMEDGVPSVLGQPALILCMVAIIVVDVPTLVVVGTVSRSPVCVSIAFFVKLWLLIQL